MDGLNSSSYLQVLQSLGQSLLTAPSPLIIIIIIIIIIIHFRWRSKDELVSDLLLWTPTYGQAKAGRPARTYIQQLCEDTGCNPEDLPGAMNDREKWREMVKDIRAGGTT